ncbi:P-loop ATPase, Sll1717 family [Sellimonas intestinalis]|uniref:P-loop ATPase, Sll1717 family n=1 Tax=Sellimonas intestinalis TaxID=1653434 RepID=UPI0015EC76E7|nr:hypothetical protein [Sellimonas intestinalis]MBA2213234.1 hypothetical protein [Sellimonas intestinalis]
MKSTCYFSYCWDNSTEIMEYLKKEVEKKSGGKVQVIFDKKSFMCSEDFIKREKEIISCDSVVVFFSPEYKKIIDKGDITRGVYREYQLIKSKLKKEEDSILEVLIKGTLKTAVTEDFSSKIAVDLSKGNVIIKAKNGKKVVNTMYRTEMTNLVSTIISKTFSASRRKDYDFKSKEEMYESLFCDTKSNGKLPKECMFKTNAYTSIMSQRCTFIIGRKGSGKTTFFEILEKYDEGEVKFADKYKILKPISADCIDIYQVYSVLEKYKDDRRLFSRSKMLQLFWNVYIYLCGIYIVCLEEEECNINDDRQPIFHQVGNKLKRIFNINSFEEDNIQETIFTQCVTFYEEFISKYIIDYATPEAFEASMVANFTVQNVFRKFLGKKLFSNFQLAIARCKKRIMIALDGFDTLSEDFRIETNFLLQKENEKDRIEGEKRAEFERLFYRSMVRAVEIMKCSKDPLVQDIHFCIVLPKDRLDQIETADRDISKVNFTDLSWDAIELLEVVVLRLEYIFSIPHRSDMDLWERLSVIMKKHLPAIPEEVGIEINGAVINIPLFEYLLRVSFWRPRDILKYYALLYNANQNMANPEANKIDMQTIKLIINNKADDIIKTEFLYEYDKVFLNISKVLLEFNGKNIILTGKELFDVLSKVSFITTFAFDCEQILNKISLLYELGVLGLKIPAKLMRMRGIGSEWCFSFNEGLKPLELLEYGFSPENTEIKFVLNPIFSKKLALVFNTNEVVGVFGKEYLVDNHARKMAIKRF